MKGFTALPDKTTVKHAADFLILTHGKATPETVQERLTNQGFSLKKATVSALLELIATEQGWNYQRENTAEHYYTLPRPKDQHQWFQFSLN